MHASTDPDSKAKYNINTGKQCMHPLIQTVRRNILSTHFFYHSSLQTDWTAAVLSLFTSTPSTGNPADISIGRLTSSVLTDLANGMPLTNNRRCPQLELLSTCQFRTCFTQNTDITTWQHLLFSLEFSPPVCVCVTGMTSFIIMVTEFIPYYVCKYNIYRQF